MGRGGLVPGSHDGMAAFSAVLFGTWLVRNHELDLDDVNEDGLTAGAARPRRHLRSRRASAAPPPCWSATTTAW